MVEPVRFIEGCRRHLKDATALSLFWRSFNVGLVNLTGSESIWCGTFARAAMNYKLSVFIIVSQKLLQLIIV